MIKAKLHLQLGFNCFTTTRLIKRSFFMAKEKPQTHLRSGFGAGDEARTRYLHLGKVALYRMSYARRTESGRE